MPFDAASAPAGFVPDLASYDRFLVAFSGKDSVALVERLLALGVDPAKVELWHHDVDGNGPTFMDWPITPAWAREVALSLGLPIYFSWKQGGFLREMMRENARTAPTEFEVPEGGTRVVGGTGGKLSTRLRFPQVSPDLSVRWCSSYLKIDVMAAAIRNQDRFNGARTLVLTGERAQESAARARYKAFEPHKAHLEGKRHVDVWRAVHHYSEAEVWEAHRRLGIVPHPAYRLGWNRLSCMTCIFGSPDQWATIQAVFPPRFEAIAGKESELGSTIAHAKGRGVSVRETAARGTPYAAALAQPELAALSQRHEWDGSPVRVDPAAWTLPAGAFAENAGPC